MTGLRCILARGRGKRIAASAAVATRFMCGDEADAKNGARAVMRAYRRDAEMGFLEVWHHQIDGQRFSAECRRICSSEPQTMAKARAKGRLRVFDWLTKSFAESTASLGKCHSSRAKCTENAPTGRHEGW